MRRSHVEMRSREAMAPRQCVTDDHGGKRLKPKEVNKMTAPLEELFAKMTAMENDYCRNGEQPWV